jgi:hypothetical protein
MGFDELMGHKDMLVTRSRVLGELASWAVQQSPYVVPDKLPEAITAFAEKWPHKAFCQTFGTMRELEATIDATIALVPEIVAWNDRKNGRDGMGFASRYDSPAADDDFIDLGALSRNIAMSTWKDCVEFAEFNAKFEASHAKHVATGEPMVM